MAENFWSKEELITEIEKGSKIVKFRIVEKDGKRYFEQREWFENKHGEELPTKKGYTWPLEIWEDFKLAMEESIETIDQKLLKEENKDDKEGRIQGKDNGGKGRKERRQRK